MGVWWQFGDYFVQVGKCIGIYCGFFGVGLVGDEFGEVVVGLGFGVVLLFLLVMVDGEVVCGVVEIGVDMFDWFFVLLFGQVQKIFLCQVCCQVWIVGFV